MYYILFSVLCLASFTKHNAFESLSVVCINIVHLGFVVDGGGGSIILYSHVKLAYLFSS